MSTAHVFYVNGCEWMETFIHGGKMSNFELLDVEWNDGLRWPTWWLDDLTISCHTRKTKISRKSQKCVMFKCYVTWCFTINHDNICTKKTVQKKKFFSDFHKICQIFMKYVKNMNLNIRYFWDFLEHSFDFYLTFLDFLMTFTVTQESTKSQQKVNFLFTKVNKKSTSKWWPEKVNSWV